MSIQPRNWKTFAPWLSPVAAFAIPCLASVALASIPKLIPRTVGSGILISFLGLQAAGVIVGCVCLVKRNEIGGSETVFRSVLGIICGILGGLALMIFSGLALD
jgi:hypothetical protein